MSDDRESDVLAALVGLTSALASGYDVVDLLDTLTADCARLLDVASAGLLLADGQERLHVMAASSQDTRHLELYQVQSEEGPCLECYATGARVSVPDLAAEADRWPLFSERALLAGFVSVHAVPMRLRAQHLGALGLFGTTVGALNHRDLILGQALADVASVALAQNSASSSKDAVVDQLQQALESRIVIEQAKGIIAQHADLGMPAAYAMLRRYTRNHNRRIGDVAGAIVDRSLPIADVVAHVQARGRPL